MRNGALNILAKTNIDSVAKKTAPAGMKYNTRLVPSYTFNNNNNRGLHKYITSVDFLKKKKMQ